MMYIQLDTNNTFWRKIKPLRNFAFSPAHFQPPETLTPEEAAAFGVYPLSLTERPTVNPATEAVAEADPVLVDGVWTQQWTVRPATPDEIASREQAHWTSIKAIRDTKTQQGGFFAEGKWFHSDANSRIQQLGLVIVGNNIPPDLQWKTMDGTFVTMTPTLANQIFTAAAQQDAAIFAHAEALKAQGLGADITAGWPTTFS